MLMKRFIAAIPAWAMQLMFAIGMLLDNDYFFIAAIILGVISAIIYIVMLLTGKLSLDIIRARSVLMGILDSSFSFLMGIACCVAGNVKLGVSCFIFGGIQLFSEVTKKRTEETT